MEKHLKTVSVLHLIASILAVTAAPIMLAISIFLAVSHRADDMPWFVTLTPLLLLFAIASVPHLIGTIALYKRKSWGRILVIIYSCLYLIGFPIGTALGVYSLWVLLNKETQSYLSS